MKRLSTAIFLVVALVAISFTGAGSPHAKCARCGAVCPCKKVCRLVCEEKNVEVTCWGCKCEDFCVPGPGCPTCEHCKCVCRNCDEKKPSGVCVEPKGFHWKNWRPSFAQMYTKTKLMKRTEVVKVPTYKYVVEDVCCGCMCGEDCECGEVVSDEMAAPEKAAK